MADIDGIRGTIPSKVVIDRVAEIIREARAARETMIKEVARKCSEKSKTRILGIFPRKFVSPEEALKMILDEVKPPWWWGDWWPDPDIRWVDVCGGGYTTVKQLEAIAWLAKEGGPAVQLDGSIAELLGLRLTAAK